MKTLRARMPRFKLYRDGKEVNSNTLMTETRIVSLEDVLEFPEDSVESIAKWYKFLYKKGYINGNISAISFEVDNSGEICRDTYKVTFEDGRVLHILMED